jgi:hypothetical protein
LECKHWVFVAATPHFVDVAGDQVNGGQALLSINDFPLTVLHFTNDQGLETIKLVPVA